MCKRALCSGCQVAIGMSDADADTAYETGQDSISFRIQFASGGSEQNFVANNSNGAEMGSNSVVILDWSSSGTVNGKDYWVEIKRTGGTTGTVSIGENNDFTTKPNYNVHGRSFAYLEQEDGGGICCGVGGVDDIGISTEERLCLFENRHSFYAQTP